MLQRKLPIYYFLLYIQFMVGLNWQAPEFEKHQKSASWYWLSIIIAIIILGAAAWQKNFLFGFFVVVAEILVLVWGNREPGMINFSLDVVGISIGNRQHRYSEFENFSMEADIEREWPNIFLNFKSRFMPTLKIRIPKNRVEEVKKMLKSFLPEVEHQPSFLDVIEDFFRF